jgi:WD40 repeat protein
MKHRSIRMKARQSYRRIFILAGISALLLALPLAISASRPLQPSILWTQAGQHDRVNAVPFSPDGQILAAGNRDQTIQLRQSSNGALIRALKVRFGGVNSVAFSPDGQLLAAGTDAINQNLYLWRVADGILLTKIVAHTNGTSAVVFTPDGELLITAGRDRTVKFWRVSDGALVRTLNHGNRLRALAISPDGRVVASGSDPGSIKLWRVANGALLHTLTGHADFVFSLAFSPDGQTLVSGSADQTIRLWQVADGTQLHSLSVPNDGAADAVAFSPDGQTILSGTSELILAPDGTVQSAGRVRFWRVSDGELLLTYDEQTGITVPAVAYSPDGSLFSYGRYDGEVVVARNPF